MSELLTAARPYAKALYDIVSKGEISEWMPVIEVCSALCQQEEGKRFLHAKHVNSESFLAVLAPLLKLAKIEKTPAHFDDFVCLLSDNKRFSLLPDVITLFINRVNEANDVIVAQIVTARALDTDSKEKLLAKLEARSKKKVQASFVIDESLIGGAIIKIGDTVIDGSVKGRIEQLAKALD